MIKLVWILLFALFSLYGKGQKMLVVSPDGNDTFAGTPEQPLKSIKSALGKLLDSPEKELVLSLRAGTYYLAEPLVITSDRLKDRNLTITAWKDEEVKISGARHLVPQWKEGDRHLWIAEVDFTDFDQLYLNGKKKILARYPNYREGEIMNGTAADALSPVRVRKWRHPEGGYIHAMHRGVWGDMHYVITGKKGDTVLYEGGFQNNRPSAMHNQFRFVENIREELDMPGEWYVSVKKQRLFYYPEVGENVRQMQMEVTVIPHLLELKGTLEKPVRNITVQNLHFLHTRRTFMEPYEPLMRSDWCIYRGAALFLENTENCMISHCEFSDLGGNAIFLSRYNEECRIQSNHIHHIGANAVCIVGDTSVVRSGSLRYEKFVPFQQMDLVPGPKNNLYPRRCIVEDNLIHDIGQVEKQVAGIEIQLAAGITVRHNTIYQVPRAAINVGDGAFGGHLIEYNDAFDTVLETSDHGAFNSWGRDRFWHPDYKVMTELTSAHPELIYLDALYTTVIRYNRFRCDHGWDIDLDDGSSNYHIYKNVCLNGGIKLREGFSRIVEGNIVINNSLHPHVWFPQSADIVRRNIFMQPYAPISMNGWGTMLDFNFFQTQKGLLSARTNRTDLHSLFGEIHFKDAVGGDYTVSDDCDAFRIGFEQIPMDKFGVYSAHLKKLARKPVFSKLITTDMVSKKHEYEWLKGAVRSVYGLGDRSAFGLPDETGVVVVNVQKSEFLKEADIRKGDVIRGIDGVKISSVQDLFSWMKANETKERFNVQLFRNQKEMEKGVILKK